MTIRKPFTGIHEIGSRSAGKGPHEGGGSRLQPYGEDVFQRVVDVNWGGGVGAIFVSGDFCCYVRTARVPELTIRQTWYGLGSMAFTDGGHNNGCSYGNVQGMPTFIMCGDQGGYGVIMTSHNGMKWATSMNVYGSEVNSVVWNPDRRAFYADTDYGCYASRTGYNWEYHPEINFYDRCPHGIADGYVGYDPANDLVIFPDDVGNDIFRCDVTAFCGGIWMAGGILYGGDDNSATICSIDGGENWDLVTSGGLGMTGDYAISCMIGGPIGDF